MHLMQCQGVEEWAKSIGFAPHYYSAWKLWRGVICWHFHPWQMEFPVPKNWWQVAHLVLSGCHYHHYHLHLHLFSSLASDLFHLLPSISILVFSAFNLISVNLLFVCPKLLFSCSPHSYPTFLFWSVLQNTWIPLKRIHLFHDVKTVRSTHWITQATTAHPTASQKGKMSTLMNHCTSTHSTALLIWAWKSWGEMVCPFPPSLLLPSQLLLQAPTSH